MDETSGNNKNPKNKVNKIKSNNKNIFIEYTSNSSSTISRSSCVICCLKYRLIIITLINYMKVMS